MINKIYIRNKLIVDEIQINGREKGFLLEDGTIIKKVNSPHDLEIQCSKCFTKSPIKTVNRVGHRSRPHVCFVCRSTGKNNPFYGHKHNNAIKKRLSEERTGTWYCGEKNPMYGKTNLDIWIDKFGEELAQAMEKKRIENLSNACKGEKNGFFGKKHSSESIVAMKLKLAEWRKNMPFEEKILIKKKISDSQKRLQKENPNEYSEAKARGGRGSFLAQSRNYKMNKIESKVFEKLSELGLDGFDYSVILGFNQYDFGNKEDKILIEVHGDYWHCNPKIYNKPKNATQTNKIIDDRRKADFAKKHGMKLYVIWENDIKQGDFSVLEEVKSYIKNLK